MPELSQALVGPDFPVVLDELPQNVLQVAATKDQQVVEDLAPGCPHPSFGRSSPWRTTSPSTGVRLLIELLILRGRPTADRDLELLVLRQEQLVLEPHHDLAGGPLTG